MLNMALKAGLPLIRVATDDTVNIRTILATLTEERWVELAPDDVNDSFESGSKRFFIIEPDNLNYHMVYESAIQHECQFVLINPCQDSPLMFNAGWLKLNESQMTEFLEEFVGDDDMPETLTAMAGLSMKDMAETMNLSMAEFSDISPEHLLHIRKLIFTASEGLAAVETSVPSYDPAVWMHKWLAVDGKLLQDPETPQPMQPRGLLFTGEPGTGKTMGAKYLAHTAGMPLYRLELGSLLNKYIGVSENKFANILSRIDQNDPCMLLIDEVEKLFQSGGDAGGTTARLLSQLLWWLQEHTSRVVTVMTTNDITILPPELYREGRVDSTYEFRGLPKDKAEKFLRYVYKSMAEQYELEYTPTQLDFAHTIYQCYETTDEPGRKTVDTSGLISQAQLVHALKTRIKHLMTTE